MPKVVTDLMNSELPDLPSNNATTQQNNTKANNSVSIYDLIQKQSSNKKEQVGVTLNKDIVDKLKTVAVENNITLSKLFENLLTPLLENVTIKPELVEVYVARNKAKGNRTDK